MDVQKLGGRQKLFDWHFKDADKEGICTSYCYSNRYTNDQFRFREILEDPITHQHIYQILQEQLGEMRMDENSCFEYFELESVDGEAGINMECSEPFFWACKDCAARFVYMFPGGGQERIIVEYPKEN